jgi:hypothetical protein
MYDVVPWAYPLGDPAHTNRFGIFRIYFPLFFDFARFRFLFRSRSRAGQLRHCSGLCEPSLTA